VECASALSWSGFSLCNLRVLCVSVVLIRSQKTTTETQSTRRLHREEIPIKDTNVFLHIFT